MWKRNREMQNFLNINCVQFSNPTTTEIAFNIATLLISKGPVTLAIPSHEDDEWFHLVVIMGIDAARGVLLAHDPDSDQIRSRQHRTQHQRFLTEIKLTEAFKAGTPSTLFFTKEKPTLQPNIQSSSRYELKRIHEDSVLLKGTLLKSTFKDISKTVLEYIYDTSHGVAFRIEEYKDLFLIVRLIEDKKMSAQQTNDNIEFIALVEPLTVRMKVSKIELDVKNISEWTTCNLEGKRIEEILPLDDKEQTAIKGSVRRRQLRM